MVFNKDKDEVELLYKIAKLSPEKFIALAKVLDINLSNFDKETGNYSWREGDEILEDIIVEFRKLKHKERKIILKAVK